MRVINEATPLREIIRGILVATGAIESGLVPPAGFNPSEFVRSAESELARRRIPTAEIKTLKGDQELRRQAKNDLAMSALLSGKSGVTAKVTLV